MIVRKYEDKNPFLSKYDYDLQEHIIILNDWVNETTVSKFTNYHHNEGNNKPTSILINGKGSAFRFTDKNGNIHETPRAQFNVKAGYRYRFRIINAGFLYCPLQFSIDNHNLTIISTDGHMVEPVEVENFIIYAGDLKILFKLKIILKKYSDLFLKIGERYDFILNANQISDNYLIKVKGYADCNVHQCFETAFLRYFNENNELNAANNSILDVLDYSKLIPVGLVNIFKQATIFTS